MKHRSLEPADVADPLLLWSTLAAKTMEMSTAAAQVIAIRTGRMAVAGVNPSEDDQRELSMMGTEKLEAFTRAGNALVTGVTPAIAGLAGAALRGGMDVFQAATRLATSRSLPQTMRRQRLLAESMLRHAPSLQHGAAAAARLAHRALDPVHAIATANARRLGRTAPSADPSA